MYSSPAAPGYAGNWTLPLLLMFLGLAALWILALILYGPGLAVPVVFGIGSIGGILHDGVRE